MNNSSALGIKEAQQSQYQKQQQKFLMDTEVKKTATIIFDIKKAYNKVNRDRHLNNQKT